MIIKALNTFNGILDLSAMERLQESNPYEHYPLRLYIRPGETVEVDDKYYYLTRVQDALNLGYIEVGNRPDLPDLNPTLVDPSYNGVTLVQTAGEALNACDLVYYKSDRKVYKAKADSTTTIPCMGIVVADAVINTSVVLLIDGLIRNSSVFSFTAGGQASSSAAIVYVSETVAGGVTQTRSTTSSHIVQIVGHAVTSDVLQFSLDHTYIELA